MLDDSTFADREGAETIELLRHPWVVSLLWQAADTSLLIIVCHWVKRNGESLKTGKRHIVENKT